MTAIERCLNEVREEGLFRHLERQTDAYDFVSNDYLGLSRDEGIRSRLVQSLMDGCGVGSRGSRLLGGQTEIHERVEARIAEMYRCESALLLGSGYLANLAAMGAFASAGFSVFSDRANHASLIDGARFAAARTRIFEHNALEQLETLLRDEPSQAKLIVTESVFSQDGDIAPLQELMALSRTYDAWLLVDEAHATGIFGSRGLGRSDSFSVEDRERLITVHTAGKALGGQGAYIVSSREVRELIVNRGRSFLFTTGLSPLLALQIEFALERVLGDPAARTGLRAESRRFRQRLGLTADGEASEVPIVPFRLGSNSAVNESRERFRARGFDVRGVRYPTVPKGQERLRITLKAFHPADVTDRLADALEEVRHVIG